MANIVYVLATQPTSEEPAWAAACAAIGTVLTSNGPSRVPSFQVSSGAGRLLNIQRLTASGTYTPTVGTTSALFLLSGGGGGGGGANADVSSLDGAGGGGASGSWCEHFVAAISGTYAIVIGAAGAGGLAASGGNGTNGGQSTAVGSSANLAAPSGLGGQGYANGLTAAHIQYGGQAGAIASGGNLINSRGQSGAYSLTPDGLFNASGFGGSGPFGAGGSAVNAGSGDQDGFAATGFGCGGGGALISGTPFGGQVGGVGTAGVFFAYEYS